MSTIYRVASMFAGVGGICLGFKNAGAEIVWANEIDKHACITYIENVDNAKDFLVEGDVKNINPMNIDDNFDILTAGFPCQAFSIAGYRKGFEDERGNLFLEIMRFIKKRRPKAFLLENVKNLASHDKGRTFKIIINALESEGYYVDSKVLNSMEYGNIPQNRERIYIVGFKNKVDYDGFKYPEKISLTKTIHDIIDVKDKKDSKYYYHNSIYYETLKEQMTNRDTVYQWRRVYVRENKSNVCPTLTANMGTGGHNVPLIIDNFGIRKLTPEECFLFQGFKKFKTPQGIGNSQLYKQAGNSVTVPVIERIAKNMFEAMARSEEVKKVSVAESKMFETLQTV